MLTAMRTSMTPDAMTLAPGEWGEVELTVVNTSQTVEHYATSVVGLPAEYVDCQPSLVKLQPDESETVRVRITLPPKSGPDAGLHTLGVLVKSPYQRAVSRCLELRLEVRPAPTIALEVFPEVGVGGSTATFQVDVTNHGNTAVAVALGGNDQEDVVGFSFRPRGLEVDPGATARATLRVRSRAPWTGTEKRRMLTVRATAGPEVAAERMLTFVQRVRVPGGIMRTVALVTGVGVMAAATVGGAVLVRNALPKLPFLPPPPAPPPAIQPVQPQVNGQPSVPPSVAAPSSAAPPVKPSASNAGPPLTTIVDFTKFPDGKAASDKIIDNDAYAASGVILSSVTDAAPIDCQNATAIALRGTPPSLGGFLTSALPDDGKACNTQPIRIALKTPAKAVSVSFGGFGAEYTLTLELSDGRTVAKNGTSVPNAAVAITPILPAGTTVKALVFGHANPDPTSKDPTILKALRFTPAG